jgi:cytochrome c6
MEVNKTETKGEFMKNGIVAVAVAMIGIMVLSVGIVFAAGAPGETLFKQHCVACHPDGGNIINPQKTLTKKSLDANKVKTADDIIKVMRNPGPGMTKFDEKTIPAKEARQIADYILKTYAK